jgi:hypothetical protein
LRAFSAGMGNGGEVVGPHRGESAPPYRPMGVRIASQIRPDHFPTAGRINTESEPCAGKRYVTEIRQRARIL